METIFKVTFLKKIGNNQENKYPEKAGPLEKMSPSLFKGWQDRFFELKDMKLSWYSKQELKGQVNFDLEKFEFVQNTKNL